MLVLYDRFGRLITNTPADYLDSRPYIFAWQ